jgi:hypothetical protein
MCGNPRLVTTLKQPFRKLKIPDSRDLFINCTIKYRFLNNVIIESSHATIIKNVSKRKEKKYTMR